jgi:hypothetical protein
MTIYIVTGFHELSGHCADIVGAYTSKAQADLCAKKYAYGHVEDCELDAPIPTSPDVQR